MLETKAVSPQNADSKSHAQIVGMAEAHVVIEVSQGSREIVDPDGNRFLCQNDEFRMVDEVYPVLEQQLQKTFPEGEYLTIREVLSRRNESSFVYPNESLLRIFVELYSNSLRAVRNGESQSGTIKTTVGICNETVEITIEDNGCGLAGANLNELTEQGYTTKQYGGDTVGKGLFYSKAYVEQALSGQLSCHEGSSLQGGPGFTVKLRISLSDCVSQLGQPALGEDSF